MDDQTHPAPQPERSNDLSEARDKTTEQIHELSKPKPNDSTTGQIHELSKPKPNDSTTGQIHELSKPKANDPTTEKIHAMSDFSVSEAVGLPLLTKDIGKSSQREPAASDGYRAGATDWAGGYFSYYNAQDRMMAAAAAVMILGPLLLGAFRG